MANSNKLTAVNRVLFTEFDDSDEDATQSSHGDGDGDRDTTSTDTESSRSQSLVASDDNNHHRASVEEDGSLSNLDDSGKSTRTSTASVDDATEQKDEEFREHRDASARAFFAEFNQNVFDGKLPADLPIHWNKRLLTTGGLTKWVLQGGVPHDVNVALSIKVLDTVHKCRDVLLHELCHVASVVFDNCVGRCCGSHGRHFKKWGNIASKR